MPIRWIPNGIFDIAQMAFPPKNINLFAHAGHTHVRYAMHGI